MKRTALGVLLALALTPSLAPAALSLQIGPQADPSGIDYDLLNALFNAGRTVPLDLVFTDTGPAENEGLFAYDIGLRIVRPAGMPAGTGVRLAGAERPPDNFVLDVPGGATFSVAEDDADHLLINVSSNNDLADITTGKKAARIFFVVGPAVPPGDYRIVFDTNTTVFGSGDPNRFLSIPVALTDVGLIKYSIFPEPGGAAVAIASAFLALCRRRRGRAPAPGFTA